MIDILVKNGDIVLNNGKLILTQSVSQRVYITFSVWLADWFYNLIFGINYPNLKENKTKQEVDIKLQTILLNIPGVTDIVNFRATLNEQTRFYTFSVDYRTTDGRQETLNNRLTLNG